MSRHRFHQISITRPVAERPSIFLPSQPPSTRTGTKDDVRHYRDCDAIWASHALVKSKWRGTTWNRVSSCHSNLRPALVRRMPSGTASTRQAFKVEESWKNFKCVPKCCGSAISKSPSLSWPSSTASAATFPPLCACCLHLQSYSPATPCVCTKRLSQRDLHLQKRQQGFRKALIASTCCSAMLQNFWKAGRSPTASCTQFPLSHSASMSLCSADILFCKARYIHLVMLEAFSISFTFAICFSCQ